MPVGLRMHTYTTQKPKLANHPAYVYFSFQNHTIRSTNDNMKH